MISLNSLKQKRPVSMPPPTPEAFRRVLDQFEDEAGRDDPLWVAQRAAENSDEAVVIVLRAVELYTRDQQLILFERINRSNPDFWQRAFSVLERSLFTSSFMVV